MEATTQKTGALRGGTIEIDTGNQPDFLAAGTQYFNQVAGLVLIFHGLEAGVTGDVVSSTASR